MHSNIIIGILILLYCIFPHSIFAKEEWVLDKELSIISFEIPVFLAKNVRGQFTQIEGLIELDLEAKENNKALRDMTLGEMDIFWEEAKKL